MNRQIRHIARLSPLCARLHANIVKPDDVSDVSGACNYTAEKEGLSFTGDWQAQMIPEQAQPGGQFMSLRGGLLSPVELAQNLELSPATLADWRAQGKGPAYLKTGRRIWYPKSEVEKWMRAQVREMHYDTEESGRHMALPFRAGRQRVQRHERLGRHKTKREEGRRQGGGSPAGPDGGPSDIPKDRGTRVH